MEITKKIYLETLKSVLGRSILHYFLICSQTSFSKNIFDIKENWCLETFPPIIIDKCLKNYNGLGVKVLFKNIYFVK